jgi:CheY-like chemotaxis protein
LTIRSHTDAIEGEPFAVIEVEDTGVGIDESVRLRMFEPFFSTRSDAGGTGLGLSIVKDIVEQVGGELEFESELGRGTCFRIKIPRHGDADEVAGEQRSDAAIAGHGRTVLLVDDDELHRRSLARLCEAQGFRPIHARGPGEAMLMAERGHEPLALAIVDLEMPYMDGRELSERLKQLRRDLPIMLVSGSMSFLDTDRLVAEATLRKPLEPDSLFGAIARLLAEPRSAQ